MEEQTFSEENPQSQKVIYDEIVQRDNSGLFSYKVSFYESDIHVLTKNVNQYLKLKFESEDISDFNGHIELNFVLSRDFELEKNFSDSFLKESIIDEDIVEKIKVWIDVTGKDFTLFFKVNDEIIRSFTLTEKTIKEEAKSKIKNKKSSGCFSTLLKFGYYSIFYGGGLALFFLGVRAIQERRVNVCIHTIGFSILLFSIPTIINFLVKKIRNK